ncbi:MAG: DUF3987 domain-containing protein, partial [Candidatus Sericytochromatia bacterium]|nr:DUF3987 domain-containing protein [Candidatus Tanganyikabacteria bacterium]
DLALCSHLAFWTGPDPARIDRLFRQSGLMRDKWDEKRLDSTYGAVTIAKALNGRTEYYSGPARAGCIAGHFEDLRGVDPDAPWPAPAPLPSGVTPVPPLDPELLPNAFRAWLEDAAERQQCPIDFPAVAAIVAAGSVIGRGLGIRPRQQDDWTIVPNLWGAVIGRPSAGKSPALDAGLSPFRRLAAEARRAHETALAFAGAQKEFRSAVAEGRKAKAKKDIKKAVEDGKEPDEALVGEFLDKDEDLPTLRRFETSDPTTEKLGELWRDNPRGILLFRDELIGWLRSLDRDDRRQDRAAYLEAWSGLGQFTTDRIGRGTVHIPAACVAILGGIQPGPLAEYVWAALAGGQADDGLLQRFQVMVWPDVSPTYQTVDRHPDTAAQDRAWKVFQALADLDPSTIGGDGCVGSGGPQVPHVRLSIEAQPIFTNWHETLMRRLRSEAEHPAIEAHLAKYPKLAAALALILHVIDVVDGAAPGPVGEVSLLRALAWCEYLESHARRVYGQVVARPIHAAKLLSKRLGALPDPFTARHVYRQGWSGLTTAEATNEALEILAEFGWIRAGRAEPSDAGGRPSTVWQKNPGIGGVA